MKDNVVLEKIYKIGKIIVVLLALILVVLTIGVSKMYKDISSEVFEEETYNTDYDVSQFKEISASDIEKETKNKVSVIYIGRETCSWCLEFLPTLKEAQEKFNYTTLYIDIAKIIDFENNTLIDQASYDTISKLSGEGYEDYMSENFGSTPMVLVVKDNEIINAQTGYSEYEDFEKILTKAGFKE